jgi:hypothetical protein
MRRRYDVCNGDADGLCAVRQWRLHENEPATLITGLKREIALLDRVPVDAADDVLVCDLSMQRNRSALDRLLAAGVRVRWFDHHAAGAVIPIHAAFEAHIEQSSRVCTSLLVDHVLQGRFRAWALVGAYGDNLAKVADVLAEQAGLGPEERRQLRRLGEAINYNAYGESVADVCLAPAQMYALMGRYTQPLALLAHEPVIETIERQRADDLRRAAEIAPHRCDERVCMTILPDAAWSRRVIGSLANERVNAHPRQAQAVLRRRADGDFVVSVRAPLRDERAAGEFCARFGGSGRVSAGGIDRLPARELDRFADTFAAAWLPLKT